MKKLIALGMLMFTGIAANRAEAGTLNALQTPVEVNLTYPYFHSCASQSFNGDDSIVGLCYTSHAQPCSGRVCVPVRLYNVFVVSWETSGAVSGVAYCGTLRQHRPQPNLWTYQPGFDASNCHLFSRITATTVQIDGMSYYYVATSVDGLFELVNLPSLSYVYEF